MIPKKVITLLENWSPRFSPGLFKAAIVTLVASAFAVPLALVALPYLEWFNDMAVQPKGKAQSYYGHKHDEELIVERPPVEGTLPMDHVPYHLEGKDEKTAKIAEETLSNPITPTMEVLAEGQKLYGYYCITCHGANGEGDGPIIGPDLFPAPPTWHTEATRKFGDGKVFHIITRGQNTMPPHADKFTPEERWAIIHYFRVLLRANNPTAEDLENAGEEKE